MAIDRRFTYEQLDEEIERAAAAIGALGIGVGDVVAVSLPNASDVVVTFHAVDAARRRLAGGQPQPGATREALRPI